MAAMPQTLLHPVTVSHNVYLAILRENPDLFIERTSRGELVVVPPAGHEGTLQNAEIAGQLYVWNVATGLGFTSESSGGYVLPNGATRAPDAAWLTREREASIPEDARLGFPRVCPDFVIELRSPSDTLSDLRAKMLEYMENGCRLGWLIDPMRRGVEVYRPNCEPEEHDNPAIMSGEDVLPGFILDVQRVFNV